ncbi:hypothetical protein JVT61DRAFT_631 [Boletus reticuloceps]|uniref:BTB domain-containing protein n=1 Tax=Boletus reticuloceps TaxID=495285 RepID=A0A8I2Z017_9AGAM|nr:hypothetical protein JVT61DRAFT_631 [Boletus reticuloceps]
MSSDDSGLGVGTTRRHEEYYFRGGDVCFQVENTLFRLHRHFFQRESAHFHNLLGSSREGDDGPEDNRFIIRDVKSDEFADLVWVWYNPRYSYEKQSKEKWLTILRLATLWGFREIKNLAIRQLEKMQLEPIEKITTYKQYAVDGKLLLPSYFTLCTSPTLPSPEEGNILTMDTVLRLASARERIVLRASELGCKTPTVASAPEDIIKAIVAELFELSLHPNESVRVAGQANNGNTLADTPAEVITVKEPTKGKIGGDGVSQEPPQSKPAPAVNGHNGVGRGTNSRVRMSPSFVLERLIRTGI